MNLAADVQSPWYAALTRSRIVVLTGAGASVPLGMPAMDGFFDYLSTNGKEEAAQFLGNYSGAVKDLETLLGRLEWFHRMRVESKEDNLVKHCINEVHLPVIESRAMILKKEVLRTILQIYGELSPQNCSKALELYLGLYSGLRKEAQNHPEVLPIFTTNYDLTFEGIRDSDSEFQICTGMSQRGDYRIWNPQAYRRDTFQYSIFRLHGCSHWVRRKRDDTIVFQAAPDLDDPAYKEPCLLYPEPGKDSRISEDPFRIAYYHFTECLRNAKFVVIIGYSGRDESIQSCLQESLFADSEKKLILVTKSDRIPEPFIGLVRQPSPYSPQSALPGTSGNTIVHLSGGIEKNTERILAAVRNKPSGAS